MSEQKEPKGPDIYDPKIETAEEKMAALAAKRARNERLREEQAGLVAPKKK